MKGKKEESHISHTMVGHALGVVTGTTGFNTRGVEAARILQSFSIGPWEDSSISVQGRNYSYHSDRETSV